MKDIRPTGQGCVQSGCTSPEVSMLHRAFEFDAPILPALSLAGSLLRTQDPQSECRRIHMHSSLPSSGIFSQQDTQ